MRSIILATFLALLAVSARAQNMTPGTQACSGDLIGTAPQCYVRRAALAVIRGANMASTADQTVTVNGGQALPYPYFFTNVVEANCTAVPGVLTAGGVYTGTGATGTAMVPASTGYGALSGLGKILSTALSGTSPSISPSGSTTTLYLHLSVASGTAATCDLLFYGNELVGPGGS